VGGFEAVLGLRKASSGLIYLGLDQRNWKSYVSPASTLVAVIAYVRLCGSNVGRAATVVAVVALIEAAVIRIPTVIFERSTVLRSDPSEATTRLRTLLGNSWRFIGIPFRDVGIPNTSELFKLRDLRSSSALAVRREVEFMELARHPDDPRPFPTFQY